MDRLHIEIDLFRDAKDLEHVLVCFSIDYHAEQKHLLQSTAVPVSCQSMKECLARITSRILEGSVFNDADPPRTVAAVPESQSSAAQKQG